MDGAMTNTKQQATNALDSGLDNSLDNALDNGLDNSLNNMDNLNNKTIIISAGGTGGHVYPALALAEALRSKGANIEWIGSEVGIENKLVTEKNIKLHRIAMLGIRRNGVKRKLLAPFILLKSLFQALRIFKATKPDLYVGFGGFVTAPSGIAAKLSGTAIIIHEQNATMGLVNRYLRHIANEMLLAFPIAKFANCDYKVIGNPVRQSISLINNDIKPNYKSDANNICRVLVVGGSQGSKAINEAIVPALDLVENNIEITHQTGARTYQATIADYEQNIIADKANIKFNVVEYIENIDDVYAKTDLVIARSGALTVSELASAGLASILIPLPTAVDNHQVLNAEFLLNAGGAVIIEEKDLTPELLAHTIDDLINDYLLKRMSSNAKLQSHANALNDFVSIVEKWIDIKSKNIDIKDKASSEVNSDAKGDIKGNIKGDTND